MFSYPGAGGDAEHLDKLIHNIEFENRQYVKQIEKEKQLIAAFEKQVESLVSETHSMQQDISHLDEDTKRHHKQFTQNRDNIESLKKTAAVLNDHVTAMGRKQRDLIEKGESQRLERSQILEHYKTIWENYKTTYESFTLVERYQAEFKAHEKADMQHREAVSKIHHLQEIIQQSLQAKTGTDGFIPFLTINELIIKLSAIRVSTMKHVDQTNENNSEACRIRKQIEEKLKRRKELEDKMRQEQEELRKREEIKKAEEQKEMERKASEMRQQQQHMQQNIQTNQQGPLQQRQNLPPDQSSAAISRAQAQAFSVPYPLSQSQTGIPSTPSLSQHMINQPSHVNRPSHVTNQAGHVTNQLGHVANQAGHVTNQLGHVTNQAGHVTNQLGQVTNQLGHVTNQAGHVTNQLGHVTNQVSHVTSQAGHLTQPPNGQMPRFLTSYPRPAAMASKQKSPPKLLIPNAMNYQLSVPASPIPMKSQGSVYPASPASCPQSPSPRTTQYMMPGYPTGDSGLTSAPLLRQVQEMQMQRRLLSPGTPLAHQYMSTETTTAGIPNNIQFSAPQPMITPGQNPVSTSLNVSYPSTSQQMIMTSSDSYVGPGQKYTAVSQAQESLRLAPNQTRTVSTDAVQTMGQIAGQKSSSESHPPEEMEVSIPTCANMDTQKTPGSVAGSYSVYSKCPGTSTVDLLQAPKTPTGQGTPGSRPTTPGTPFMPVSEASSGSSPFDLDKHMAQLKMLNKSPGTGFNYASRPMFQSSEQDQEVVPNVGERSETSTSGPLQQSSFQGAGDGKVQTVNKNVSGASTPGKDAYSNQNMFGGGDMGLGRLFTGNESGMFQLGSTAANMFGNETTTDNGSSSPAEFNFGEGVSSSGGGMFAMFGNSDNNQQDGGNQAGFNFNFGSDTRENQSGFTFSFGSGNNSPDMQASGGFNLF